MIYRLMQLGLLCGISTMIWGVLFGGYFGNAVSAFCRGMLGIDFTIPPLWFDSLAEPMNLFILSLVFGFVQIALGLCLRGYQLIRKGRPADAVCDAGFWLLVLAGAPLCLASVNLGLGLMGTGALGILLTGGRTAPSLVGKITGGLGSLYRITGYLADLLSYSRLMALGLATAVIAQVMNTMSTLAGGSLKGWLLFVIVFIVGHIFNVLINVIGTYVHTSRLQYIEFFGKFYEPGGRPFAPVFNKTKYVEIIKESD
jgi:V/A-type H+-transporting ATPase subunit I